jgi:hypothetical protein
MADKNRRKRLRKISVGNIQYLWLVSDFNCDGDDGSNFKIYENKTIIYSEIIHCRKITPEVVRETILKLKE